ncbi:MAG: glycosyltransferase family 39 protein [Candidatus Omnitrophota bacterium]
MSRRSKQGKEFVKKGVSFETLVPVIVVIILIAAFAGRIGNFTKKHPLTFDEYVYSVMSTQIDKGVYNTMGIYEDEVRKGKHLPAYFRKPIFKHPPVFSYLVSISCKLFGNTFVSAFKVSLFFGVLLILMAYLLSAMLFHDRIAALYAAFMMSIEPISWVSSQKVWMETTLAFFFVLSLFLFFYSTRRGNPYTMLASGFFAGCAALTKYPGILAVAVILLYAASCDRKLFRQKSFIASLLLPFLMLIPWIVWNYRVYGPSLFAETYKAHRLDFVFERKPFQEYLYLVIAVIFIFALLLALIKNRKARGALIVVSVAALCVILRRHIFHSFDLFFVPKSGWEMGMFGKEPWYFYLGRLIELSPLYVVSLVGLVMIVLHHDRSREYIFLFMSVLIILAFYVWWRNYQSRYILALITPLMVISSATQVALFRMASARTTGYMRIFTQSALALIAVFFLIKTFKIDMVLAVPNAVCYF